MVLATLLLPSLSAAQTENQPAATPPTSAPPAGLATSASDGSESQGWTGYVQFQGSSSTLGGVLNEAVSGGYDFTPHFGLSAGLPLFHVRSPCSIVTDKDWRWTTLLGEPWVDVHYTKIRS